MRTRMQADRVPQVFYSSTDPASHTTVQDGDIWVQADDWAPTIVVDQQDVQLWRTLLQAQIDWLEAGFSREVIDIATDNLRDSIMRGQCPMLDCSYYIRRQKGADSVYVHKR
jgi:hypothetical protein